MLCIDIYYKDFAVFTGLYTYSFIFLCLDALWRFQMKRIEEEENQSQSLKNLNRSHISSIID